MNYWAGLDSPSNTENIRSGVDDLLRLAATATSSSSERQTARRDIRLIEGQMADPDAGDMYTDENDA
jgi:hypothetical protein